MYLICTHGQSHTIRGRLPCSFVTQRQGMCYQETFFIWAELSFESFSLPILCALHAPELLGTIAWGTQPIARSSGVGQSLQHIQHHLGSSLQSPQHHFCRHGAGDSMLRLDQSPQHTWAALCKALSASTSAWQTDTSARCR